MIRCDWPDPCPFSTDDAGKLAGHFANDHFVSAGLAFDRAQRVKAEQNGHPRPNLEITRREITMPPPVPVTFAVAPPPAPKEDAMPTHARGPNPEACKHCARYAPEKCKRHGGPSHGTSYAERKGRAATKTVAGTANGSRPGKESARKVAALDVSALASQIRHLVETAEAGRRAQAELDLIRKALA